MSLNKFQSIVDELLSMNLENRKFTTHARKILSPLQYLKEICTVHVDIGRCSGKTDYIIQKATKDDLIVVANQATAVSIRENIIHPENMNIIYGNTNFPRKPFDGFKIMYVDDPKFCFQKIDYYTICKFFLSEEIEQTIVMLGE